MGSITNAINKLPSTLTWGGRVAGAAWREGGKAYRNGSSFGDVFNAAVNPIKSAWNNGSNMGRASMVGTGIVGTGATVAAADLLNPWGLGWGD